MFSYKKPIHIVEYKNLKSLEKDAVHMRTRGYDVENVSIRTHSGYMTYRVEGKILGAVMVGPRDRLVVTYRRVA